MATRLYWRIAAASSVPPNTIGKTLSTTADNSEQTKTLNTEASASELLFRDAASLATPPIIWISDYVAAAFSLAGQITFGMRVSQSASSVNAGVRCNVYKLPYLGNMAVLVGAFDRAGEITSEISVNSHPWNATPATAVPFAVNDRLAIMPAIYPQGGSIGAGTVSWRYAQAAGTSSAAYVELTENVAFSTTPILNPIRSIPILGQPRPLF